MPLHSRASSMAQGTVEESRRSAADNHAGSSTPSNGSLESEFHSFDDGAEGSQGGVLVDSRAVAPFFSQSQAEEDTGLGFFGSGDLKEDVQDAFERFKTDGTFAFQNSFVGAPNPCLMVEGLGTVGLPLSTRDADAIIAMARPPHQTPPPPSSSPSPPSGGTHKATTPGQTREVDASKIQFSNRDWEAFVERVVREACSALGVVAADTDARLEKLVLCGPSPHSLPKPKPDSFSGSPSRATTLYNDDSSKARTKEHDKNVFGTLLIILPSIFDGGEASVSHARTTETFDVCSTSTRTSTLCWHAGATYDAAPITSGYQLALSYNLVHTNTEAPIPRVVDHVDDEKFLKSTLRKWASDLYPTERTEENVLAYTLQNCYSRSELRRGSLALRGSDDLLLAYTDGITKELGFRLFLAPLTYRICRKTCLGSNKNSKGVNQTNKRANGIQSGRASGSECKPHEDELAHDIWLGGGMVDLDGKHVLSSRRYLSPHTLIPSPNFESIEPDEIKTKRGNPGRLYHYYYRTVLVIYHESNNHRFTLHTHGLAYALSLLRDVNPYKDPNLTDAETAAWAADRSAQLGDDDVEVLFDIAARWGDAELWSRIWRAAYPREGGGQRVVGGRTSQMRLIGAVDAFGFLKAQTVLNSAIDRQLTFWERVYLIEFIASQKGSEPSFSEWYTKQNAELLNFPGELDVGDVPLLMTIAELRGIGRVMERALPILKRSSSSYAVYKKLYLAIAHSAFAIRRAGKFADVPKWEEAGDTCLKTMVRLMTSAHAALTVRPAPQNAPGIPLNSSDEQAYADGVSEAVALVQWCFLRRRNELCAAILGSLFDIRGVPARVYACYITPSLRGVKQFLSQLQEQNQGKGKGQGAGIASSPFREFAQHAVGMYLSDVLGQPPLAASVKRGCEQHRRGGRRCVSSPARTPRTAKGSKNGSGRARPYAFPVRKRSKVAVVAKYAWRTRQAAARAFMAGVGTDQEIRELMGDRYLDMMRVLVGTGDGFSWDKGWLKTAWYGKA